LEASSLRKEQRKQQGIFQKTQQLLFQHITFLLSNQQNLSLPKLNLTLRNNPPCQAVKKEKDIRWPPTNARSVCGRTDIRRSNRSASGHKLYNKPKGLTVFRFISYMLVIAHISFNQINFLTWLTRI